jgi:DNA polymerase alpha-associated DNA helicase A
MDDALDRLERTVLPSTSTDADGKAKTAPERTKLVEVLLGMSPLSSPQKIEELNFFDPSLNDSQKAAVRFALEAPELACIHGPPGAQVPPLLAMVF